AGGVPQRPPQVRVRRKIKQPTEQPRSKQAEEADEQGQVIDVRTFDCSTRGLPARQQVATEDSPQQTRGVGTDLRMTEQELVHYFLMESAGADEPLGISSKVFTDSGLAQPI